MDDVKKAKRGKPKARGNGSGSVSQLPSGSWHWEIRLRGQRFGGTVANKTLALGEISRVKTDFARGTLASPDKTTFQTYAQKWLDGQKHLSRNTRRMYTTDIGYASAHIGTMMLRDVRYPHVKAMIETLSNQVMKDGTGKTMSTRTLGMVQARVKAIFSEAVRDQIIYVNPADAMRRVKASKDTEEFEGTALDFDQAARLQQLGEALYEAGRCALYPAIFIATAIGLRRGEVMALRWQDVDLEKDVLRVCQNLTEDNGAPFLTTTKTNDSTRDIPILPSVKAMLETHRAKQSEQARMLGLTWHPSSPVFATVAGTYTHPANLYRALQSLIEWSNPGSIKRKERSVTLEERLRVIDRQYRPKLTAIIQSGEPLPKISPHDLRHTAGTLMLRSGMLVEVVSKILGHARVSITMDIYRHVSDSEKRSSMVDLFGYKIPAPIVAAVPIN